MRLPFSLLLLSLCASLVSASSGDRDNRYKACLSRCQKSHQCEPNVVPSDFPLAMRLTRWTCLDNCKYTCMHDMANIAIESGVPIQQYYGKWPFWRFMGMQEPASVLFSFTNLLLHVWGRSEVQKDIPNGHPMKKFYVTWSLVSCNAWLWSMVFHTRDTPLTEKLDYFSAALTILYSLYFSVIRLFHFYPQIHLISSRIRGRKRYFVWSLICIIAYVGHVSYLSLLPRFDYTYNIIFNLVLGLAHNFLWLAFSLPSHLSLFRRFLNQPRTYRPRYATDAAKAVVLTTAATCLELFDFAPWKRTVDAHALWHLSTAPLAVIWYDFLITDAADPGWKSVRL